MDSWNPTDPERLADTESGGYETPGPPLEDAGYDVVDEVHVDIIDVVDQVEVVDVMSEADVVDEIAEVEASVYDEDQGGEQPVVDTAPAAPAATPGPAGTTTPEASIDEVEAVLDQADEALARLDDGTYGRCVHCGQSIQDDRLAEDPTDQRCGECVELVSSGVD
jgi:RNA polymerase-binding transcription factor DksA